MSGPLSMLVKMAIAFAVAGVIIHDVASIALTRYGAGDVAQSVADAAATTWRSSGRNREITIETAKKVADQKGAELIGFTAEEQEIIVKIKMTPKKTVIVRYIKEIEKLNNGEAVASSSIAW